MARNHQRIRGWPWLLSAGLLGLSSLGCAHARQEKDPWSPKPLVYWGQLSTQPLTYPLDGFVIVIEEPTRGLFPASLAVGRLGLDTDDAGHPTVFSPQLVRDPRNEFLQWNTAFDNQMAISEVFPIAQRDLGGGAGEPTQLLAAMRALGGRIGLIYAVNELSDHETEMLGALYQTEGFRPLATIHAVAQSVVPPDQEAQHKPRLHAPEEDLFETDSKALVRKRFEDHVYACVRELIIHDEPAEVESPKGWVPDGPLLPAEWPPHYESRDHRH
ncbi:MAG: hypothetical protein ACE5E5_03515 [Phycisphaerae bacterium]